MGTDITGKMWGADLSILLDLALGDDEQGRGPARSGETARGEGGGQGQRGGARRRGHCSRLASLRSARTLSYPHF
jgi:hypothetical protein